MGELARATRGMRLPQLTRPASAGQIRSGYQALDGEGKLITGTAAAPATIVTCTVSGTPNAGSYAGRTVSFRYSSVNGLANASVQLAGNTSSYGPAISLQIIKGGVIIASANGYWGLQVSGATVERYGECTVIT